MKKNNDQRKRKYGDIRTVNEHTLNLRVTLTVILTAKLSEDNIKSYRKKKQLRTRAIGSSFIRA